MQFHHAASMIVAAAGLFWAPGLSLAQNAPAASPMKTIGTATTAQSKMEPALIVMNARGATLQGQTLTLTGVTPNSIIFADRPVRAAGHALTAHLIEEWATGDDSFG